LEPNYWSSVLILREPKNTIKPQGWSHREKLIEEETQTPAHVGSRNNDSKERKDKDGQTPRKTIAGESF
jgi:hypothetical protein